MEVKLETPLGLRRSPRRRGSDSDLETTVGTAPGDLTSCSLDDTVEITAASANSSTNSSVTFSPFKVHKLIQLGPGYIYRWPRLPPL